MQQVKILISKSNSKGYKHKARIFVGNRKVAEADFNTSAAALKWARPLARKM